MPNLTPIVTYENVCLDKTHPYFNLNLTEILRPLRLKHTGMGQGYYKDAFEYRVLRALQVPLTPDELDEVEGMAKLPSPEPHGRKDTL